jgi:hypothetical protein
MKTLTIDQVMELEPCHSREHILELAGGRTEMTVLDILRLDAFTADDRLWLTLREDILGRAIYVEAGCRCAEHVLPIYESKYPGDDRPRNAIETRRRYEQGTVTQDELDAAGAAARAAAWAAEAAAWTAAWAATWAATWAAARAAAWAAEAAAWTAAWAAERQWQLDMVIGLIEQDEEKAANDKG